MPHSDSAQPLAVAEQLQARERRSVIARLVMELGVDVPDVVLVQAPQRALAEEDLVEPASVVEHVRVALVRTQQANRLFAFSEHDDVRLPLRGQSLRDERPG